MKPNLVVIGGTCLALSIAGCSSTDTGGSTSGTPTTNGSATILSPTSTYGGKTYGEWGATWWKWVLEMPGPTFPVWDGDGSYCAVGQAAAADVVGASSVYYLAGYFTPVQTAESIATRSCTIPAGRTLLLPLAAWFVDNAGVPPGQLMTDDQMKNITNVWARSVSSIDLEIDGQSYGSDVSAFDPYLTRWSEFSYTVPNTSTNFYETFQHSSFTGLCSKSFGGGYWVMIAPLSPGQHTIHFRTEMVKTFLGGGLTQDLTYNLTIL